MNTGPTNEELLVMLRTVVGQSSSLGELLGQFRTDWEEVDRLKVMAETSGDGAAYDKLERAEAWLNLVGRDLAETLVLSLDRQVPLISPSEERLNRVELGEL